MTPKMCSCVYAMCVIIVYREGKLVFTLLNLSFHTWHMNSTLFSQRTHFNTVMCHGSDKVLFPN